MDFKYIYSKIINILPNTTIKDFDLKNAKKICFLGYGYQYGDLIVSTFLFREIKKIIPNVKIVVSIESKYFDILKSNPYIDEIALLPTNFFKMLFFLRKYRFDVVIDLPWHRYPKSTILAYYLSKTKVFICSSKYNFKFINYNFFLKDNEHITDFLARIVSLFGNKNPCLDYNLYTDKDLESKVYDFIKNKFDINRNILLINAQASVKERTLNEEKLRFLVKEILKYKPEIQILILSYNYNYLPFDESNVAIYQTSNIKESVSVIKFVNYVLTTDTSIVHISDFFRKNMIVLYADDKFSFKNNSVRFSSINRTTIKLKAASNETVSDIKNNKIIEALKTLIV